jgi:hypothetical protein
MKNTSQHFLQSDAAKGAAVEQTGKQLRRRGKRRLPTTELRVFLLLSVNVGEKFSFFDEKAKFSSRSRARLSATSTTAKRERDAKNRREFYSRFSDR